MSHDGTSIAERQSHCRRTPIHRVSKTCTQSLAPILGSEAIVLEILNHQRKISDRQANELAAFFHISPQLLHLDKP
ncbi:hypothetical protein [Phormidesmis sp. 146-33]